MAQVVGGDILEIGYNHPTLGSGTFFPKSGEDSTSELGGLRSEDDDSAVDGSGAKIRKLTRRGWSVECTISCDANVRTDQEKLAALSGSTEETEFTITYVNGTVYSGTGNPVGDIAANTNNATIALKIAGGGVMKKIAG